MLPAIQTLETLANNEWRIHFMLATDLACFEGHFDAHPVLPGVVQIDWAVRFAEQLLQQPLFFAGMRNIKFMQIIKPNVPLNLLLEYLPAKHQLKFCYQKIVENNVSDCAKGIIELESSGAFLNESLG